MKFSYPDLTTVTHADGRWYDTPAGWMPSITTILGGTEPEEKRLSLQQWRDGIGHEEADRISREATENGTLVHLLCERHLKGEDVFAPYEGQAIPLRAMNSYRGLKMKLRDINEVWGQEVALYSTDVEVAGRTDVIGVYKNKPAVIDFKTAARVKDKFAIHDYYVQLAFYGKAHNEMFGTDIDEGVVLIAAGDGFPQEFRFKLSDHYPELRDRAARYWQAAINTCA